MAVRSILLLPDARLRRKNLPVQHFDHRLTQLIDDMFETMYANHGIGLAAPQIGINLQLFVIDVSDNKSSPLVFINPTLTMTEGEELYLEGCLSIPGAYERVKRAKKVSVNAQDKTGQWFERTEEGLLGDCIQHEFDHLQGKLFIDHLSTLKQTMVRKKLEKYKRTAHNA